MQHLRVDIARGPGLQACREGRLWGFRTQLLRLARLLWSRRGALDAVRAPVVRACHEHLQAHGSSVQLQPNGMHSQTGIMLTVH